MGMVCKHGKMEMDMAMEFRAVSGIVVLVGRRLRPHPHRSK